MPVLRQVATRPYSGLEDNSSILVFAIWGLDSVGPLRTTPGGYKHILVAVEKFTKWIEVRAVASVTSKAAAKFIEDSTHRFGVPNRIITNLGSAFT
jgi:hypothetical protein